MVDESSPAEAGAAPRLLSPAELAEKTRKRIKHREYVKRSYQKKIITMQTLKDELDALERQYSAMLARRTASHAPLLQQYLQLANLKAEYQSENALLYHQNAEFMKIESRIQQMLDVEPELSACDQQHERFQFTSLPETEYAKIIARARDDVLAFVNDARKLSTGSRVFGWTDQRKIAGDELKFALEKRFDSISAYDLLQRSWPIFSSPERFAKVYSPALNIHFHQLERVNDDTVLLYRTVHAAGSDVLAKTVFLLARLRIDHGYMILFRSIDRESVQFHESDAFRCASLESSLKEVWVDKYSWVIFQEQAPLADACVFHFGGSTLTNLWLKEVLFIALRWEIMAVGPQVTLE